MARRVATPIDVDVDTSGVNRMEEAADGLDKALRQLQLTANKTFTAKTVTQYAKATTGALDKVQKSVQSVKRSLADFDEVQRLSSQKTASSATVKKTGTQLLLEMLQNYDCSRALVMLNTVTATVQKMNTQLELTLSRMQMLEGRLSPLSGAMSENAIAWQLNATAQSQCAAAMQIMTAGADKWISNCTASTAAVAALKTALSILHSQQEQVFSGFRQMSLGAQLAINGYQQLGITSQQTCTLVQSTNQTMGRSVQNLFSPAVLAGLQAGFGQVSQLLTGGFAQLMESVNEHFLPGWRQAWLSAAVAFRSAMASLPGNMKQVANSTIDVYNGLLSGITRGYNEMIAGLNRQRSALSLATGKAVTVIPNVPTPRIPQLATGAVLPANRPFMAVVGDQRHGTNVEAPLTTIQEAVAVVMEDQTAAIMAGFEASVQVQKAILEAVLGISIGDDVIGQASQRYMQKMAIMRGGQW